MNNQQAEKIEAISKDIATCAFQFQTNEENRDEYESMIHLKFDELESVMLET